MNLVELDRALRQLRLSGMAAVLETRLRQAQTEKMAPLDLVSALVTDELRRRQDRLLERRHKLARFRDAEGLTFPLLSDPSKEVLTAYGAYGEKQLYGKTVVGVIRATFVIDEQGRVEQASYAVKAKGHVAKLRRDLGV